MLEAWLALTSVKYQDNLLILMLLNQWLALTMRRTTGPRSNNNVGGGPITILRTLCFRFGGHVNKDYKVDSCLSSSDTHVVSGSEDGRIIFWDLVEAKIVFQLDKAHESVVYSLSYHPSEICLLSASSDGKVKVWHSRSWELE